MISKILTEDIVRVRKEIHKSPPTFIYSSRSLHLHPSPSLGVVKPSIRLCPTRVPQNQNNSRASIFHLN